MLPGVYGFTWDAGNLIFLGIFFAVTAVIAGTVSLAAVRAHRHHRLKNHGSIAWLRDFHDLPQSARVCRHVLTGELRERTCPNAFDCRVCDRHREFLQSYEENGDGRGPKDPLRPARVPGFRMPLDRLYHRGHAWVKMEADGLATVGLDEFAGRVFGTPDEVELPPVGTHLHANRPGWKIRRRGTGVRVLAPLDGTIVATGGPEKGWYLKVQPPATIDTRHLLHGDEVQQWISAELERLRGLMRGAQAIPMLADGGEPAADIAAAAPEADWDGIWGEVFLEP